MSALPTFPPHLQPLARLLDRVGQVYNDYEVVGLEHLPLDGPSLVVIYHGFMPLDGWYLSCRIWRDTGRLVRPLADRFLFDVPLLGRLMSDGGCIPGEREAAVQMLREGQTVLVSPGGVREALVGRQDHYKLVWGQRVGFADVAIRANAPIIPAWSENVEELYRSPFSDSRPLQELYERTRVPIVPIVGLGLLPFPVRVRTHLGAPIHPAPGDTPESLRDRVRAALQAMLDSQQRPHPRLARALAERLGRRRRG